MKVERQGDKVHIELWPEEAVTLVESLSSAALFHGGGTLDELYGLLEDVLEPERQGDRP